MKSFLMMISLLAIASCDGGSSGSTSKGSDVQDLQVDNDQGVYRAVLSPLNTAIAGKTTGTVEITLDGDEVVVESTVAGAPSGVKHLQNVMELGTCPTEANDLNTDGVIDIAEGAASFGKILIPLDSNLGDQILGNDFGPIANGAGAYVYRRSTSFALLMADLNTDDPDKDDYITKLSSYQNLTLSKKVIVIHGVNRNADLPATVATIGETPADQLIPIACGQLIKVQSEDTATADDARRETTSETTTESSIL
jgi:hypothetical protein